MTKVENMRHWIDWMRMKIQLKLRILPMTKMSYLMMMRRRKIQERHMNIQGDIHSQQL